MDVLRLTINTLTLVAAGSAFAGSFVPVPLSPEHGVTTLDRSVSRQLFDRELLGASYDGVTLGNVDVYDRFPYLEARYFQVLSDPKWNRLVFGASDAGMDAYDGASSAFGPLSRPHGLASDAAGRIYVADTGNDRVLVLSSSSEFDRLRLSALYEIGGLAQPYDVAIADGGTPLDPSDDLLYVANSGANQVQRWELHADGAEFTGAIGELGSGEGHFAGPMAITVGREDGRDSGEIFVADAHNQRFVRLVDENGRLRWDGSLPHDLGTITSLDTDHHGNVYAAAPQSGRLAKFNRALYPVAELSEGLTRPRSFHVPRVTLHDHVAGSERRIGHDGGLLIEEWSDRSGLRMLEFGVELSELSVEASDPIEVGFLLSDRAGVRAEIRATGSQELLARADLGTLDAGQQRVPISGSALLRDLPAGRYELQLHAVSTYAERREASASAAFRLADDRSAALPDRVSLGQATPNPFNPSTTIHWSLPADGQPFELAVYDARGRLVRVLERGISAAGTHATVWNGRDDAGHAVASGIYHYRLVVGDESMSRPMALVK